MNPAEGLMALAIVIASLALLAGTVGRLWLRAKELNRQMPLTGDAGLLTRLDARLERLEQGMETMAVEVERIAESQRFATNLLVSGKSAPTQGAAGESREQS